MITSAILWVFYFFAWTISSPLRLLSDVSLVSGLGGAIATATNDLAIFRGFLPFSTLFIIIGLIFSIELVIIGYKLIMWVIHRAHA